MRLLILMAILMLVHCRDKKAAQRAEDEPVKVEVVTPPQQQVDERHSPAKEELLVSTPDFDTTRWEEVVRVSPSILLDLRYATENNFVKEKMYDCPRCFLRPEVAKAVVAAHNSLQKQGYGLKMYDCYRPRPVQWKLWNKVPDARYVADPRKGSMHNRGMAVDLTIVDREGKELDMGTAYDYFGEEAYHNFPNHPEHVLENRQLLLQTMEEHGLYPTPTEWWHYSYRAKTFPLDDWLWLCQ